MSNKSFANQELSTLSPDALQDACGGGIPWRKIGEYVAPVLVGSPATLPLAFGLANKGAAAQAATWATGGAVSGIKSGPQGVALNALGGGLAGYYGSLLSRDIPTK